MRCLCACTSPSCGVLSRYPSLSTPSLSRGCDMQVANPLVRANAAALLVAAFPLQDPDAGRPDRDRSIS